MYSITFVKKRDSEDNEKKKTWSSFKIIGLNVSKIVRKLNFFLITRFLGTKSKKFQEQICL